MKVKKIIYNLTLITIFVLSLNINNISAEPSSFLTMTEESQIDKQIELGKDIIFNIDLSLIDYDAFRMYITSNQSLDTLTSTNVTLTNGGEDGMYFDYNINANIQINKITLKYKMPASISSGDKITFTITVVNKNNETETKTITKNIIVTESGGQVTNPTEMEKTNEMTMPESVSNTTNTKTQISSSISNSFQISSTSTKTVSYPGSDNNYLKSLSVTNYSLNRKFSKDGLTYFVTVDNSVKSIKVKANADSSKSTVSITGNTNLEVGLNKVLVSITSESGLTRVYRIYVTREDK